MTKKCNECLYYMGPNEREGECHWADLTDAPRPKWGKRFLHRVNGLDDSPCEAFENDTPGEKE